jgi:glucose-1-phosphate adenylyltransferase
MGIYVFNTHFLCEQLSRDADDPESTHDFGHDIIPNLVNRYRVYAHRFEDSCVGMEDRPAYWHDVGTVDAYWEANMGLVKVVPDLNLYDKTWPIWTHQEQLPPAKFIFDEEDRHGIVVDSMVSGGCIIGGATIHRSLIFSDVKVNNYSKITDSVILPRVEIGRYVRLNKVIVDKQCVIPDGLEAGFDPITDAKQFHVTEKGVTLITQDMLRQSRSGFFGQAVK